MKLSPSLAAFALCAALLTGCQSDTTGIKENNMTVTMKGNPVNLVGQPPRTGDKAPAFTALNIDMSPFNFQPGDGGVYVLAAVPSLDTPVCSTETRRFNQEATNLQGVKVVTISMDLPFAQKRWCGAEGVKNVTTVSDFKDRSFGDKYGLRIKENGLLARSVFVVGKDGRIAYEQVVPELTQEPNYEAAIAAARKAAGQ